MKYLFSIILFSYSCFSIHLYAQKCKYDFEKNDAFSGKSVKAITETLIGSWKITFEKNGDDYFAEVYLLLSGHQKEIVSAGDSMLIALDGSKPVKFVASETVVPKHEVNGTVIKTWYKIKYPTNAKTLSRFNEGVIKAIRVFIGSAIQEYEIPAKNAAKITNAANCIIL